MITHRSHLAVPISSTLAYNHTQDNHSDNLSGIRTRAIEIVNVFEMEFRWEKDILLLLYYNSFCRKKSYYKKIDLGQYLYDVSAKQPFSMQ